MIGRPRTPAPPAAATQAVESRQRNGNDSIQELLKQWYAPFDNYKIDAARRSDGNFYGDAGDLDGVPLWDIMVRDPLFKKSLQPLEDMRSAVENARVSSAKKMSGVPQEDAYLDELPPLWKTLMWEATGGSK